MFELIFFIILVSVLVKKNKQKQAEPKKQNPYPIPPAPIKEEAKKQPETVTYIKPTRPYRPAHNAGERYETWFPIPEGKEVCHCNYCGADNLIPKRKDPHLFTCYFCREELSD